MYIKFWLVTTVTSLKTLFYNDITKNILSSCFSSRKVNILVCLQNCAGILNNYCVLVHLWEHYCSMMINLMHKKMHLTGLLLAF